MRDSSRLYSGDTDAMNLASTMQRGHPGRGCQGVIDPGGELLWFSPSEHHSTADVARPSIQKTSELVEPAHMDCWSGPPGAASA